MTSDTEHLSYTCSPFLFLLWRNAYSISLPSFHGVVCLISLLSYRSALYLLDINLLSDMSCLSIFFPFYRLPFHCADCFLNSIYLMYNNGSAKLV